jgi:hypothetical protein
VLGAGRVAITEMATSLRRMVPVGRRDVSDLDAADMWHGEGGLMLFGKDLKKVRAFADAAAQAEPAISTRLASLLADLPTSELAGFDARLKSFDSLARKVATEVVETDGIPVAEALKTINDSIRYTVVTADGDFVAASSKVTESLTAQGFENVSFKNTFGSDGYQGINTNWRDPESGRIFEVQFHTPMSFAAKTETHPIYEVLRIPGIDPARAAMLRAHQNAVFDTVPRPVNSSAVSLPPHARIALIQVAWPPWTIDELVRRPLQPVGYVGVGASYDQDPTEGTP